MCISRWWLLIGVTKYITKTVIKRGALINREFTKIINQLRREAKLSELIDRRAKIKWRTNGIRRKLSIPAIKAIDINKSRECTPYCTHKTGPIQCGRFS